MFFLAFEFLKELDLIQNLICFPWSRGLQQIRPFKKENLPSLGLDLIIFIQCFCSKDIGVVNSQILTLNEAS